MDNKKRTTLKSIIADNKRFRIMEAIKTGKFFTIKFVKKNGELRELNGRLGVKKHLKGGSLGYDPKTFNYIIVFDVVNEGYRTVNVDTVIELTCNKNKIEFAN
tara:strand:+ start:45 stop:353 length:309 start_codon:yes stop_codon:yes gene_type:complete